MFEIAETSFTFTGSITNTNGIVQIDPADTLTVSGVAINGGAINDGTSLSGATIDVAGNSEIENADLNNGGVTIASSQTLTLDGDTVTRTVFTDTASGAIISIDPTDTLTVSGVTINGGTINDGTGSTLATAGTIDVTGNSDIENASLNNGGVTINAGQTLTLDSTTVTSSTITELNNTSGATPTAGLINIDSGKTLTLAGAGTINGGVFGIFLGLAQAAGNNSVFYSLISIASLGSSNSSVTLTIQASSGSLAALSGPGLTVVNGLNGSTGTIEVTGTLSAINAALSGGLTYTPGLGITSNTLTFNVIDSSGDTAFRTIGINTSNPTSPAVTNISTSGQINNAGLFDVTGTATLSSADVYSTGATLKVETTGTLTLDDTKLHSGTVTDNATVGITGFGALSGVALNIGSGDQLTIDSAATLFVAGGTITGTTGAAINDGTSSSGGSIDVLSSSTISGVSLNNGSVTINAGQTLTLDGTTVTGSTITELNNTSGATPTTGLVNIDSGKTLTLAGADTINGGVFGFFLLGPAPAANNSAFYSLVSIASLSSSNSSVTLTIQASSGSLAALSGPGVTVVNGLNGSTGTIEVTGTLSAINAALSGGLTYTPGSGITSNTLTFEVIDSSGDTAFRTIGINTSNPALPTGTNISTSGQINNAGVIDVTGTATLSSADVYSTGATLKVGTAGTLTLDDTKLHSGTVTDNGTVEITGFSALSGVTLNIGSADQLTIDPAATLSLTGTTINNGTVNDGTSGSGATITIGSSSEIENASLNNGGVTIARSQNSDAGWRHGDGNRVHGHGVGRDRLDRSDRHADHLRRHHQRRHGIDRSIRSPRRQRQQRDRRHHHQYGRFRRTRNWWHVHARRRYDQRWNSHWHSYRQ